MNSNSQNFLQIHTICIKAKLAMILFEQNGKISQNELTLP